MRDLLKAVIFDMDGVIIDSEPIYFEIERKSFGKFGLIIPEAEHHSFVGITLEEMWHRIKSNYGLPHTVEELLVFHKNQVIKQMSIQESLRPIDGVLDLIRELREKGIKTAIASSSPVKLIDIILNKLDIKGYFDLVVSGEEVEKGKPEPDIFLKAARILSIKPSNCVVIEDSRNGIIASLEAGMPCIGFKNPNSGNQDLSKADKTISHFSEIDVNILNVILEKRFSESS
ncbi:MAG: HAD family hydrolase [Clostridia bacterium]|nr:HAD family hydrolase [Clostridia bacterium]